MIGRTLAEEEEIAATGNRTRFSNARAIEKRRSGSIRVSLCRRRPVTLKPQVFLAIPSGLLIVVRVWFILFYFLCGGMVVSHFVHSHPIVTLHPRKS
jgi:hypothetical protein